jgi:hypothetical protein
MVRVMVMVGAGGKPSREEEGNPGINRRSMNELASQK